MSERDIFIEEKLVTIDGSLATVGVTRDLDITYDGSTLTYFSTENALCFAGLLRYPNKLMYSVDRIEAMRETVREHDVNLGETGLFIKDGKIDLTEIPDRIRKPAERDLTKKHPVSSNVLSLGYTAGKGKQLVFITDMGTMSSGFKIIEDEFGSDYKKRNHYEEQFKKQYRERERLVVRASEQDQEPPKSYQSERPKPAKKTNPATQPTKQTKSTKQPATPKKAKRTDQDIELLRERALALKPEEVSPTHPRKYLDKVMKRVEKLDNGVQIDFTAIVAELREEDPNLQLGVSEWYYREATRRGLVKKQNSSRPSSAEAPIIVRFNK